MSDQGSALVSDPQGLTPSTRRGFITLVGGCALAWPLAVRAQQRQHLPRVGIIWILSPHAFVSPLYEAFRQGLREAGYVEGQSIVIEVRSAEGRNELLFGLAEELVRLKVDVIVAPSTAVVQAVKQATAIIPIVMGNTSDPVGLGFIASLRRPGGNITGLANLTVEQVGKNVELCKELVPSLSLLAVLVNPTHPDAAPIFLEAQAAGRILGIELLHFEAHRPDDLEVAVVEASQRRCGALLVSTIEGIFGANRMRVIAASASHRLPAVFAAPPFGLARSGVLLAYGANVEDMLRRAAGYVDKVLKGANPAELPVEQPSKFTLAVNLRTATALGITIPPSILRADEVIE